MPAFDHRGVPTLATVQGGVNRYCLGGGSDNTEPVVPYLGPSQGLSELPVVRPLRFVVGILRNGLVYCRQSLLLAGSEFL